MVRCGGVQLLEDGVDFEVLCLEIEIDKSLAIWKIKSPGIHRNLKVLSEF